MKLTEAILAACMAMSLAGCALRGAPKTAHTTPPAPNPVVTQAVPPPPPAPLSIPQTNVDLPKSQPLDPEALVTLPPPPEPPAETSTATRSPRRPPGAVPTAPPRTETPPPAVVTVPQPEQERPPIQEIVPPADQKRLQDSLQQRKAEINQILDQTKNRTLTKQQAGTVRFIRSFVEQADDAEKHGDLRQADALAERAQVLAKELQNGK